MAREIVYRGSRTGLTNLRRVISSPDGTQRWNGTAFEDYDPTAWATYTALLTEDPPGGLEYVDDFPAGITDPGAYPIEIFQGSGDITDTRKADGPLYWNGSAETDPASGVAAAVWAYATRRLTQSAVEVAAVVAGEDLALFRGDTWEISLEGLGDLTGNQEIWFTAKGDSADSDSEAVLQITRTGGLERLNGAAGTALDGTLTIDNAALGNITIRLEASSSKLLEVWDRLSYDVQVLTAADAVETRTAGSLTVSPDVTLAVA